MSPRTAKSLVAAGIVSYAAMWIFMAVALVAFKEALDHAEVAIHGDITNVAAAVHRASLNARIGALLGLLGYLLLFVGVMRGGARARWIYRAGLVVSISSLLMIPVGTILGICALIHFRRFRHEYLAVARPPAAA